MKLCESSEFTSAPPFQEETAESRISFVQEKDKEGQRKSNILIKDEKMIARRRCVYIPLHTFFNTSMNKTEWWVLEREGTRHLFWPTLPF